MEKMEPQTSNYIEPAKEKMNISVSLFKLALGAFFLALVLGLPSGITAWFDGLPWTGEMETIALAVIIPFLLILGWRFLALRLPILLLGALLILKIVLFLGSPAGGWLVKVHPSLTQEQQKLFQKEPIFTSELNKNIFDNTDLLTDDSANEKTIKILSSNGELNNYDIIHYATHAIVIDEVPELNAIIQFAEDGRRKAIESERCLYKNEKLGLFHGVPFTVKDCIDTAGILIDFPFPATTAIGKVPKTPKAF